MQPLSEQDVLGSDDGPDSKLPPAAAYEAAVFPSLEEQAAAKEAITKQWDTVVGANVQ